MKYTVMYKNGKELSKNNYLWNSVSKNFFSLQQRLMIDYGREIGIMFDISDNCNLISGNASMVDAGDGSDIIVGDYSTVTTGSQSKLHLGAGGVARVGYNCELYIGDDVNINALDGCKLTMGNDCVVNIDERKERNTVINSHGKGCVVIIRRFMKDDIGVLLKKEKKILDLDIPSSVQFLLDH